jgi:threonine dehydratase
MARIRGYGAKLVVTGERYAEALAASEAWISETGALAIHAYDQVETLLGQATVGLSSRSRIRISIHCWSRWAAAA